MKLSKNPHPLAKLALYLCPVVCGVFRSHPHAATAGSSRRKRCMHAWCTIAHMALAR